MTVPKTCASFGRSALSAIQETVYLCGTQTSCDHLLDARWPKALYPQYLTVRVCRLLNMNFGESTFLRTRLRRPSSVNKTLLGGITVVVERLAPLDLKGSE